MPRRARISLAGIPHHIIQRGNNRTACFYSEQDYLLQTIHKETNPRYWQLVNAFKERTGCGLVVNTSFNVRGEPIVCTPEDAYRCFMRTEMDWLVIGDFLFDKKTQRPLEETGDWRDEFKLD